jgi:hypothetical protein
MDLLMKKSVKSYIVAEKQQDGIAQSIRETEQM